jgi:DNA-binding transcriptional regulator YbjK
LEVIAEHGVSGTSHRKVAAAADVPLGSMTYHFSGMDELLHEAFARFADQCATRVENRMQDVTSTEEALEQFALNIELDVFRTQRELVLALELYTLAARRSEFREITDLWMTRTRETIAPYVGERTAQLLDALNEGMSIQRALSRRSPAVGLTDEGVQRLTRDG